MSGGSLSETDIAAIVGPWVAGGHLADDDRAALKAIYDAQFGARKIEDCTPCYWSDFSHYFRFKYRQTKTVMANPKYIVHPDVKAYRPFGQQKPIVTEGEENDETTPLTDALAEELLAAEPALAAVFILNPDYAEPTPAQLRIQAVRDEAARAETERQAEAEKVESARIAALLANPPASSVAPAIAPESSATTSPETPAQTEPTAGGEIVTQAAPTATAPITAQTPDVPKKAEAGAASESPAK